MFDPHHITLAVDHSTPIAIYARHLLEYAAGLHSQWCNEGVLASKCVNILNRVPLWGNPFTPEHLNLLRSMQSPSVAHLVSQIDDLIQEPS